MRATNVPAPRPVIALLSFVVLAAAVALARTDVEALPVGMAFLGLVVASRMSGLRHFVDVAAVVAGLAAYVVLEQHRGADGVAACVAAGAGFALAAVAARLVEASLGRLEGRLRQTEDAVDEIAIHDAVSGTLKRRFGEKAIEDEVRRARRTNAQVTVVLLATDPPADHPLEVPPTIEEEAQLIGGLLRDTLRLTDRSARLSATTFAAILPATDALGGNLVAEKLRSDAAQRGGRLIRCGVATFPEHAVSAQELLSEADAALRLARTAGLPLVSPTMLHHLGIPVTQ